MRTFLDLRRMWDRWRPGRDARRRLTLEERRARAALRQKRQRIGSRVLAVAAGLVLLVGLPLLIWLGP